MVDGCLASIMEPHLLPVYRGPLDGAEKPFDPSGWMVEVTDTCAHKYLLRQNDDGSRFWAHYAVVPLSSVNAA